MGLTMEIEFNAEPTKQATEIFFSCKKSNPTIRNYYSME